MENALIEYSGMAAGMAKVGFPDRNHLSLDGTR